jgi:hypothetical protein
MLAFAHILLALVLFQVGSADIIENCLQCEALLSKLKAIESSSHTAEQCAAMIPKLDALEAAYLSHGEYSSLAKKLSILEHSNAEFQGIYRILSDYCT